MKRTLLLVATLFLVSFHALAADGNTATPIATGTIANNLSAHDWRSYEYIDFCGLNTCGDGGGGMFHRETCVPDGVQCLQDGAGYTFRFLGLNAVYGGLNIRGTETVQHRSSVRLSGTITPSIAASVASSIADVQTIAPSSTATSVGGLQMLPTIDACASCDPASFGLFLYGGHLTIASTYAGPNPIPAIWEVNPAKPTFLSSVPILDHVYYALPGGANSCEPSGVTITVKCEGISVGSFPDIPGAGGTMTISSGVFNVPNGSPNAAGSDLEARAIQIGGTAGTASGGAVVHAYGILETATALNKFAGDLQSNDTFGWYLDSGVDCDSGTPVVQPSKAMPGSGMGCHDHTASNWNMSAAGVEDIWGNNTGLTVPVRATFSDNVLFTGIATTPGGAQPLCIGAAGTIFKGSGGGC